MKVEMDSLLPTEFCFKLRCIIGMLGSVNLTTFWKLMHSLAAADIPELFLMGTLNLLTNFGCLIWFFFFFFKLPIGLKVPVGVQYNQVIPWLKVGCKSALLKLDTFLERKNNFLELSCIY